MALIIVVYSLIINYGINYNSLQFNNLNLETNILQHDKYLDPLISPHLDKTLGAEQHPQQTAIFNTF